MSSIGIGLIVLPATTAGFMRVRSQMRPIAPPPPAPFWMLLITGEVGSAIAEPPLPPLADIISVLFVVDLTNSKPGTSGRVWLSNVRFER